MPFFLRIFKAGYDIFSDLFALVIMKPTLLLISVFLSSVTVGNLVEFDSFYETDCSNLRLGQYICPDPSYDLVDPKTQQPRGCTKMNVAKVLCRAADGIICHETKNSTFYKNMPCKWTNGYSFETALLLSIFLGMFGVDRFYLGYPGHGLLKLCSLGYMFIGQLYDILRIATQTLRPADGSYYVMAYFGPGVEVITSDNETYKLPQDDWY